MAKAIFAFILALILAFILLVILADKGFLQFVQIQNLDFTPNTSLALVIIFFLGCLFLITWTIFWITRDYKM